MKHCDNDNKNDDISHSLNNIKVLYGERERLQGSERESKKIRDETVERYAFFMKLIHFFCIALKPELATKIVKERKRK